MRLTATRTSITSGGGAVLDAIQQEDPTLDLNFEETKTLTDDVSGNNLITFTRASSGTYVDGNGIIQSATTNTPRFDHDPVTVKSLGLLKEEASTNLLIYSEEFDQSDWQKSNTTVTPNATTAPDGTTTADLVLDNTVNTSHAVRDDSPTLSSGIDYTFSVYAKAQDLDHCFLLLYSGGGAFPTTAASYDLTNLTASSAAGTPVVSIEDAGNGWRRLSMTATTISAATTLAEVRLSQDGVWANRSYAGSGQGIYLWGAQLEANSLATSYIPTTSSTVTRAADILSITGTNFSSFYNQSAGTLFVEYQAYSASGNQQIAGFTQGTNNAIRWGVWNNQLFITNSGTQYFASLTASASPTKVAFAATGNDAIGALNGTLTAQDTSVTMPAVDNLHIGGTAAYLDAFSGHIKRLAYFSTREPEATLENITS